jgi:hypothetical protein
MSNRDFFKNLPHSSDLKQILSSDKLQSLPDDWYVIITDIVNSTIAIENNKYKDVNTIGGLSIVGITNIQKDLELPFIFGGDGVSVCIPKAFVPFASKALSYTAEVSEKEFGLKLRVGIVPAIDIYNSGKDIKVAKLKVSPRYSQTIFLGTGMEYAEYLIKKDPNSKYLLQKIENHEADFSGFSCRWKSIPSVHDEIVSIIIKAMDSENEDKLYDIIIPEIDKIFGGEESYHPVVVEKLDLSMDYKKLIAQAKIETKGFFKRFFKIQSYRLEHLLLKFLMKYKKDLVIHNAGKETEVKASQIKETFRKTSDFRKYDGTLKMVISGTTNARKKLENFIEDLFQKKQIAYGIHISKEALMTCLLFADTEAEVHFIDGSDGGYALAAKDFKKRLASLKS